MKRNPDVFYSKYVIDGVRQDVTPADMLDECMLPAENRVGEPEDDDLPEIWDEKLDVPPENMEYSAEQIPLYIRKVTDDAPAAQDREFNVLYPESFARQRVAASLIDTLWLDGEFRLDDLRLWAEWGWDSEKVGNMAAFYDSVQSATEYIYDIGVEVQGYLYEDEKGECVNSYFTTLASYGDEADIEPSEDLAEIEDVPDKDWEEDDAPDEERLWTVGGSSDINIDENRDVWMGDTRKCSARLVGGSAEEPSSDEAVPSSGQTFHSSDNAAPSSFQEFSSEASAATVSGSFLIYVPFDTCSPRLGGSLLAKTLGCNGGAPLNIADPDYFIDCYEVVRDLVSDGVVLSSRTVCDGGLAVAAEKLAAGSGLGIRLNVNGICAACGEADIVKVLFAEVPGVLLQIADDDSDYIDSQFLLQDVAYYRVGRPDPSVVGVEVVPENNGIDRVLSALLNDASEGED